MANDVSGNGNSFRLPRPRARVDDGSASAQKPPAPKRFTTWAGQYSCAPRHVHVVRDEAEAIAALASISEGRMRVLGSALSPSDIAMSDEHLLLLDGMRRILHVDASSGTVRVQAGARISEISAAAAAQGLAFPVLGSISDQTIAGAVATAAHGTGQCFGVLSTLVEEVRLITPAGEIVDASRTRNAEIFHAACCGLGSLGVMTELTLRLCSSFDLEVRENSARLEDVLEDLPERLKADHYRFWYLPHAESVWEWHGARVAPDPARRTPRPSALAASRERLVGFHAFQALLCLGTYIPAAIPAINRWYAGAFFTRSKFSRKPSEAQFNIDCLFSQDVSEWAIPIEHTAEALRSLRQLIAERNFRVHLPIEVRFVKGDDIWLSPCYGRDSCYIGVIAYRPYGRAGDVGAYFDAFESLMRSFGGRPHWAKHFRSGAASLEPVYPRWDDFQRVRAALDPEGQLSNSFTDRVLGPVATAAVARVGGKGGTVMNWIRS